MAQGQRVRGPAVTRRGMQIWAIDLERCRDTLLALEAERRRLPEELGAPPFAHPGQAASHVALRLLLERQLGRSLACQPYQRTASGKPSLGGVPLSFNLSHCAGMALVAIGSEGPIGVDVEPSNRKLGTLLGRAHRIEAAAEILAAGRALPGKGDARVLAAWVRLEALAKADGAGIAVMMSRLGIIGARISEADAAARAAGIAERCRHLAIDDIEVAGGFVAAIARPAGAALPPVLVFPAELPAVRELASGSR